MTSGAAPQPPVRPVHRVRLALSLSGAVLALAVGWWATVVLAGRNPVVIPIVLLVVPVLAVVVPAHRLEPAARVVLAVGWVLALNTVVAQLMLSLSVWNVPVGVLVVTGISVAVWVGIELATSRADRAPADRTAATAIEAQP
ncbi:hypothetical protein [Actinomycetospora callitridis]|uniref:hypothetical protein n=1 Tax=Actinomycetospora callitridis TaxID=913944 RepID=UPI0023669547|nr:hypothetical protein [Actinomycetospora callitridis]MDD7917704.1 hypothetical protein [Actinomycetospora callitridis]